MALRSRPFKFRLWRVAHLQKRSCRPQPEKRFNDLCPLETCKENTWTSTASGRACVMCCPDVENASRWGHPHSELPTKGHQVESVSEESFLPQHALPSGIMCIQYGAERLADEEEASSAESHDNSDLCCDKHKASYEVDVTRAADALSSKALQLWPYVHTADDILYGRRNALVHSATLRVDPSFVEQFFAERSQRKPVPPTSSLDDSASEAEGRVGNEGHILRSTSTKEEANTVDVEETVCVTPCTQSVEEESRVSPGSLLPTVSDFVHCLEFLTTGGASNRQTSRRKQEVSDVTDAPEYILRTGPLPGLVYFAGPPDGGATSNQPDGRPGGPSLQQLINMQEYLTETAPRLFVQRHDYRVYKPDIIFENNYFEKPQTTVGLNQYAIQLAKLRIMAHVRFANVRLTVMKITVHEEDGTVRMRWRLQGIPQSRAFMFWKFLPWNYRKQVTQEAEWHEGLSTFYVDNHGMIGKHRLDRVMPDEELAKKKAPSLTENLTAGLA